MTKGPVVVVLNCEARESQETITVDRDKWDAMTPAQRRARLDADLDAHVADAGGYGWHIDDPDDYAATEGPDDPDALRELAEWLVSLDGKPVTRAPRTTDIREIICRAREALGKEG
jgi:hypothetical protein